MNFDDSDGPEVLCGILIGLHHHYFSHKLVSRPSRCYWGTHNFFLVIFFFYQMIEAELLHLRFLCILGLNFDNVALSEELHDKDTGCILSSFC